MSARRRAGPWAGLLAAAGLLAGAEASAQEVKTSSATLDREAELFGAPEAAREAEMFGAPAAPDREAALFGAPATSTTAEDREAKMFGEPPGEDRRPPFAEAPDATERLLGRMADKDDFLDVGGVLWLWLQAVGQEDTDFFDNSLSAPSFVDVYLDARPSDRVRAYARARTNFDPTVDESAVSLFGAPQKTRVRLDQLWLKFDVFRRVFLTLGKQRIRWGAGQIWNPTDFLNPTRLDALNFLDTRLGVTLAKVHVPLEALGWNFYAIASFDDATSLKNVGGALRAEMLLGPAEVTMSAALQKDRPLRLGADISMPVWEFDFRVEAALLHDVKAPFFGDAHDTAFMEDISRVTDVETLQMLAAPFLAPPIDRSDDWIPQIVVGADYIVKYNDDDTLVFALEYFFNDAGSDNPGTYLVQTLNRGFDPLYMGRHYLAFAAYLNGPGDWDDTSFSLAAVTNLTDPSAVLRFNYGVQVLTYLRVNAFVSALLGRRGTEFRFGFRVPPTDPEVLMALAAFNPDAAAEIPPELTGGFELNAPLWQAGATIVVDL